MHFSLAPCSLIDVQSIAFATYYDKNLFAVSAKMICMRADTCDTHRLIQFLPHSVKVLNALFIIKWILRVLILLLNKQNRCGIMKITAQICFSTTICIMYNVHTNTCVHILVKRWTFRSALSFAFIHVVCIIQLDCFFFLFFGCIENRLRSILFPRCAFTFMRSFTPFVAPYHSFQHLLIFPLAHTCNPYPT